jgi:predicted phage-related endonuclease
MKIDSEDIPKTWFCQVQYQLGVAGLEQGSLAWLSGGREFGYKDISFVPDFYEWLVAEADKFWIDYVKAKVEPSYINVKDVMLKYNRHTDGKVEEVDFDIYSMCHDLKEIKKQMDALEEAKEKLEGNIKMAFGDAEAITFAGETIATWKAPKPSSKLDTKALVRDEPFIAARYMVPTQGARRFILK